MTAEGRTQAGQVRVLAMEADAPLIVAAPAPELPEKAPQAPSANETTSPTLRLAKRPQAL
jgi:hypothetical protein